MFKRIDHIALTVKDRVKSIQFYEQYFGFKKCMEKDVAIPGVEKVVFLKLGDTFLELLHMPNGSMGEGFHFCLESDNLDEDFNRLKNAGVPVAVEPCPVGAREPGEENQRRAMFIGPDGEQIEIRG